ncbi:hypothetical protein Tco_1393940 [Tanacetum coccineum]
MDDPNITMEEYIRLEEEKARRQGRTFNWQTARYRKIEYYGNEDDSFTDFETEYSAIVLDDASLSCEPTDLWCCRVGQYRAAGPGFYQRNNSYPDRRQTLEESLTKFMAESAKRHKENSHHQRDLSFYRCGNKKSKSIN